MQGKRKSNKKPTTPTSNAKNSSHKYAALSKEETHKVEESGKTSNQGNEHQTLTSQHDILANKNHKNPMDGDNTTSPEPPIQESDPKQRKREEEEGTQGKTLIWIQ